MSKIDPKNADELLKVVSKKLNVPADTLKSSFLKKENLTLRLII